MFFLRTGAGGGTFCEWTLAAARPSKVAPLVFSADLPKQLLGLQTDFLLSASHFRIASVSIFPSLDQGTSEDLWRWERQNL